jgi:hypothetical protein
MEQKILCYPRSSYFIRRRGSAGRLEGVESLIDGRWKDEGRRGGEVVQAIFFFSLGV